MKTNTLYIFIISVTLFVMNIYLFLYTREGIFQKTSVVTEYYQMEKQNNNFDFSRAIKKDAEQIFAQEPIIKKVFLEKDKIVDFITKIETQGRDLNVLVQDIKYGDAENIEEAYSLSPILFNIQVEGSLSQIKEFVKEITKSESVVTISEFKLHKIENQSPSKYSARITIRGTTISYE